MSTHEPNDPATPKMESKIKIARKNKNTVKIPFCVSGWIEKSNLNGLRRPLRDMLFKIVHDGKGLENSPEHCFY